MATKNSAGGFKQMPKMETTEPSVILKMKKGGHVNTKHLEKGEHGHAPMSSGAKYRESMEAESGSSPKKPSMSDRKKAMNPNFKGGGKVHKLDGGAMVAPGGANPQAMAAMANPAMRAAMAKKAIMQRAMAGQQMARPAMGGAPAMGGGLQPGMKKGGKAGDMAQDKAMIKKAFKEHDAQEHKGDKGTKIKLKSGGVAGYVNTKMHDGDKKDRAHGAGEVKDGKPGGYAAGGTITGNAKQYAKTKVHDDDRNDSAHGTKGVRMSNAGGFAKGGNVDWENRPADTAKAGPVNTKTGEVKEANAGGYKHGGKASKKAYATGGSVNDEGKAVKMPRHFVSRPVANSLQSGTFKKGGRVKKFDDGGSTSNDQYTVKDPKAVSDKASRELEDALNPMGMVKDLYGKAKSYFTPPAGSVTKTEKSVTVAPGKKRGGSAC